MSGSRWALVGVLVVVGVYFLIFHTDPLPMNHEAIGLGKAHLVHDAIAIVLLVAAGYVWYVSRKLTSAKPA
ncbi:MAG: hypothetical protein ACT4OI_06510 [Methanobacteriota archaeon]